MSPVGFAAMSFIILGHRGVVLFQERGFICAEPGRRIGRMDFMRERERRGRESKEDPPAQLKRGEAWTSDTTPACECRNESARRTLHPELPC